MKSAIVFSVVLAVATAQFFNQPQQQFRRPGQPAPINYPTRPSNPVPPPNRGGSEANANIVRYENSINPDGSYTYSYETDNGIAAQESGTPREFGGNPPVRPDVAQGAFSWTSPEGQQVAISYVADENGYQPQGDAIPTAPPIPPQILRALEYIARNPPRQ